MPAHRLPPDHLMDCDHITHPEHWLGDCGDIANHFAPVPVIQDIANATQTTLAGYIDPTKVEALDLTGQRFPTS